LNENSAFFQSGFVPSGKFVMEPAFVFLINIPICVLRLFILSFIIFAHEATFIQAN